jgi:hypothetical protein
MNLLCDEVVNPMNSQSNDGERRMSSRGTRLSFPGRAGLALAAGLFALLAGAPAQTADGDILADSMADWSATGTQGESGWFSSP